MGPAARWGPPLQNPGESPSPSSRPQLLEYAIVRLGAPLGIVTFGIGLMAANHFLSGAIVLYFGLALVAVDAAYECRSQLLRTRIILGIAYVIAVLLISWICIFRSAPVEVNASVDVTAYGRGSKISGISWQPHYTGLYFSIKNATGTDYDDFNSEVSTDLVIADLKQLDGLSNCDIASTHPPQYVHVQPMTGDQPSGPADSQKAQYAVVPIGKDMKPLVPASGGADWSYRMRCDKIPAHSQSDFLAAIEVVNPPPSPSLFGDPKPAKWITLSADFYTSGRHRSTRIEKCQVGETCIAR